MASGTVYSGYVTSNSKKFMRARINWTTTETATAVAFSFDAGVQIDSGYTTNAKITVSCLGQSKTVDNKGWGGGYHQMISGSTSWSKSTSAQSKSVGCTITLANGSTATGTVSITVPALTRYSITYNANGSNVSNLPATNYKYYNQSANVSATVPTRTGHTFLRWNTTADGNGTNYSPGQAYTVNNDLPLYAVWQPYTYTVSYDANGGSGSINSVTKTYGVDVDPLSDGTGFSRALYTLTGWNTSADGTGTPYALGGIYSTNANVTLYAQWQLNYVQPVISDLNVVRLDKNNNVSDDGEKILVEFDYIGGTTTGTAPYIAPEIKITIDGTTVYDTVQSSGSDSFSEAFGTYVGDVGTYSNNTSWTVEIEVWDDSHPVTTRTVEVPSATFPIDILGNGSAMGVMTPAVSGQKLTLPYDSFINGNRIGGGGVIGAVQMFAGSTAPNGWLLCDGSAVSRSTYSALFAVIGTTYGTGDGSTTFNLPNLQGRVPVGASSSYTLGDTGGEATHQLLANELPKITGSYEVRPWRNNNVNGAMQLNVDGVFSRENGTSQTGVTSSGVVATSFKTVMSFGNDEAHNNMQPYVVMNYIINAGV